MEEFTHEFFEEASKEFMRGKVRRGHMIYYVCSATLKSGKPCQRRAVQDVFCDYLCTQHTRSKMVEQSSVDEPKSVVTNKRSAESCEGQHRRSSRAKVSTKV